MRGFAERIIACEGNGNKASRGTKASAFPVPEKLRPQLATLMGRAGFRALLLRALALAKAEVPWLSGVQVDEEGSLEGWEEPRAQLDADKFLEGRVVLLAQLLGLLVAFIGENLTLRLVREVWPKLPLNDGVVGKGDKNEK
jgi:hypothetical protein